MGDWDEAQHHRDEQGRFGSGGGGGLSTWAQKRAERYAGPLAEKTTREGGFTFKPDAPPKERTPKAGILVSQHPREGLGHVVEVAKMKDRIPPPTEKQVEREIEHSVEKWLEKALPAIKGKADLHLGGWKEVDKQTGKFIALHFDVSQKFSEKDERAAIQAGRDRNQKAIWHIGRGEEIDTGGTGR
jgi:hypothetical protein